MRRKKDLPDMKFKWGDNVSFQDRGQNLVGVVKTCDYGGAMWITSFEFPHHTYDVQVEQVTIEGVEYDNVLFKHIPERDIKLINVDDE